jgi:hypothetical protein
MAAFIQSVNNHELSDLQWLNRLKFNQQRRKPMKVKVIHGTSECNQGKLNDPPEDKITYENDLNDWLSKNPQIKISHVSSAASPYPEDNRVHLVTQVFYED